MIHIKTKTEIQKMRDAGKLAAEVLSETGLRVKEGISTLELNDFADKYTLNAGAISAPLNYKGFPKSICTSVNHVVCHGIPNKKEILKKGDIINIDITVIYKQFHGDTSRTFFVGDISEEAKKLVETTEKAMWVGIETIEENASISKVGEAIEEFINPFKYGIVRDLTGHGIGKQFHEDPPIPHYKQNRIKHKMKVGMTFTVEPMVNIGSHKVIFDMMDGWTVRTEDSSLSAQFEHTCLVTPNGYEVLTLPS